MSAQQLINRKQQQNVGELQNADGSYGNDENPELQNVDRSHGNDEEIAAVPKSSRCYNAFRNVGKFFTSFLSKKDPRPITRYQRQRAHQRQNSVDDRLLYNAKVNAQASDEEPKSAPLKKSPSLRELGISSPTMISCTIPGVMSLPDLLPYNDPDAQ